LPRLDLWNPRERVPVWVLFGYFDAFDK